MKQIFLIVILSLSGLNIDGQNREDALYKEADSLYNGRTLATMWNNHSFNAVNVDCNNSEAIKVYVKRLRMIKDYINQKKTTYIDYLISNFELLTGIESESDASYAGKINPTMNDIKKWKKWLRNNKKRLCYYEKHNILFLRKE